MEREWRSWSLSSVEDVVNLLLWNGQDDKNGMHLTVKLPMGLAAGTPVSIVCSIDSYVVVGEYGK